MNGSFRGYHDQFAAQGMRCVQQVSLLRLWEQLRGSRELPPFSTLVADDISRSIDKLSFCEVVQTGSGPRFRIIRSGAQFERMYPERRVGMFLDQSLSPAIRDQALERYRLVVTSRAPSFSFSVVRKDDGPIIRYERLLLPFSCDGAEVERIVGVITLFSEHNGFTPSDVTSGTIVG
jgi:hypothetical protein